MTISIYKITNTVNGKCYVGQSWNIESRWHCYRQLMCRSQTKLFNALKKHGLSAFTFEVVTEYADPGPTQTELDTMEACWMDHFHCVLHGYNLRQAGSHGKFSDASKERMRQSQLGKTQSDETKEKHRLAWLGREHTPESKAKMSTVQKGHAVSDETREKIRHVRIGKKHTAESIAKMGELHKGKFHTEEAKARMSLIHTGKKASPEAKAKMSEAAKRRHQRQAEERADTLAKYGI